MFSFPGAKFKILVTEQIWSSFGILLQTDSGGETVNASQHCISATELQVYEWLSFKKYAVPLQNCTTRHLLYQSAANTLPIQQNNTNQVSIWK